MADFQDKVLVCRDCGSQFTFTARDQEFFIQKGFNDPVRCYKCRQAKKSRQQQRTY